VPNFVYEIFTDDGVRVAGFNQLSAIVSRLNLLFAFLCHKQLMNDVGPKMFASHQGATVCSHPE